MERVAEEASSHWKRPPSYEVELPNVQESGSKTPKFYSRIVTVWAAGVVLWWLAASLIMPWIIAEIHGGAVIPVLSDALASRRSLPLQSTLDRWEQVKWWGLLVGMLPACILLTLPQVQARARGLGTGRSSLPPLLSSIAIVVLGVGAVFYSLLHHPVAYVHLINENWWAEAGTFASYFVAGILFSWALLLNPSARRPGMLLMAIGAFFIAFEEIKWGQDVLGLSAPDFFVRGNAQGQITLHNMIALPRYYGVIATLVLIGSVALPIVSSAFPPIRRLCVKFGIPLVGLYLWPFFVVAALFLGWPGPQGFLLKFDEIGELALALAAAMLGLHYALVANSRAWPGNGAAVVAQLGTLALIAAVTQGLVLSGASNMSWQLHNFATSRFPLAGMHQQAEETFEYLTSSAELRSPDTYLEYGKFLKDRGRDLEAAEVLARSVDVQDSLLQKHPEDPQFLRNQLEALTMLGRQAEAESTYRQALELDGARLAVAEDSAARAEVLWSIAQTRAAAGDDDQAADATAQACTISGRPALNRQIRRWLEWRRWPVPPQCGSATSLESR